MKIEIELTNKDIEITKKAIEIGFTCLSIGLQLKLIEEIKKL